jgi:hypothetical protein
MAGVGRGTAVPRDTHGTNPMREGAPERVPDTESLKGRCHSRYWDLTLFLKASDSGG